MPSFLLCLNLFLSAQALAFQSKEGFSFSPPENWQAADPKNGCSKNSLCFVPNPHESESIFIEPSPPLKAASQDIQIQNLMGVLSFKDASSEKELIRLKDKLIEGFKKYSELGVIKNYQALNSQSKKIGKYPGLLLESKFELGHYPFSLFQAFISGPQRTVLFSCSFDFQQKSALQALCSKSFESIQFK